MPISQTNEIPPLRARGLSTDSAGKLVVLETCCQCGGRVVDRWPIPDSALVCCSRRCRARWLADVGGWALDDGPEEAVADEPTMPSLRQGDRVRLRPEASMWVRVDCAPTGEVVECFTHADGTPMVRVRRDGETKAEAWSENAWEPEQTKPTTCNKRLAS